MTNAGPTQCNDPKETETINKAEPAISTDASKGEVTVGEAVPNDTAHLSGLVNPSGTRSISFSFYDNANCNGTPVAEDTVTVNTNGDYSTNVATLTDHAGTYYWVASYSGDANNNAADRLLDDATEQVDGRKSDPEPLTNATATAIVGENDLRHRHPQRPGQPLRRHRHLRALQGRQLRRRQQGRRHPERHRQPGRRQRPLPLTASTRPPPAPAPTTGSPTTPATPTTTPPTAPASTTARTRRSKKRPRTLDQRHRHRDRRREHLRHRHPLRPGQPLAAARSPSSSSRAPTAQPANKVGATLNATDNPVGANGPYHSPAVSTRPPPAPAPTTGSPTTPATPTTTPPTAPASTTARTRRSKKRPRTSRPTPPPPRSSAKTSPTPPPSRAWSAPPAARSPSSSSRAPTAQPANKVGATLNATDNPVGANGPYHSPNVRHDHHRRRLLPLDRPLLRRRQQQSRRRRLPRQRREHDGRKSDPEPLTNATATAIVGQNISDAATLSGLVNPTGAGAVTFDLFKGTDCSARPTRSAPP